MTNELDIAPVASLLADARALHADVIGLRRALHRSPELGLTLPKTQQAVLAALSGLDLTVSLGRAVSSVVAVLDGARPGPTVLLRGDMDALPLQEDTGLEFASTVPGVMHACGHDTHVAMLVGAARLLAARRADLAGRVVFMFQPGEEGHHGARWMLEEGLLERAGAGAQLPCAAYALHITSSERSGTVHLRPGPALAASDVVRITVRGTGGHAAAPHETLDPVPVACELVQAIQTLVTRRVDVSDPAVVTISHIVAGTTNNIIPADAFLEGTIRTLSEGTRDAVHAQLTRLAVGIAAAHGLTAEVEIDRGYPVTINDAAAAEALGAAAGAVLGDGAVERMPAPIMGAEDWSYVLQQVPGAMAFLGACPPGIEPERAAPNHSNLVVFDEAALPAGAAIYAAVALRHLSARG